MSLIDEARTVRQRILDRMRELEPLVREYNELKQAAAEMGLAEADVTAPASGNSATRGRSAGRGGGRGKGARTPARNEAVELKRQVLEAVRADPGKTVGDYAQSLDQEPAALYRIVRELTTDGALVKRARALYPS